MRRLAVSAITVLALAGSAVLLAPAGGSEARPTGIELADERPPSLMPLELLGMLRLMPGNEGPRSSPRERPLRRGFRESVPQPCFRDGSGRPCVQVCTRFVASRGCDRFSSPNEGCLRFVRPDRSRCLDGPAMGRPALLPAGP